MLQMNGQGELRALRDIAVGERVEVQGLVIEALRPFWPPIGITRGETVRCERQTRSEIVLRHDDGRRIDVDPFYACFIGIRSVAEPPHPRRSAL